MKTLISAVAVLALAGVATAGPVVFSQTQNFGGELSPFATNLQFNQLDVASLNLQPGQFIVVKNINLFIEGEITANVTAENNNIDPAPDFGVSLTGFLSVTLGSLAGNFAIFQAAASGGVAGSDNVIGGVGVPNGSGPDFFDFGLIGDSGSDDDKIFGADPATPEILAFLGNGTLNAAVFASGGFAVTGASNATLDITDFMVSGSARLDISYNIIPTPGAIALFGMAGLAATRRRRA